MSKGNQMEYIAPTPPADDVSADQWFAYLDAVAEADRAYTARIMAHYE